MKPKNDFKKFIEDLPIEEQECLPVNVKLATSVDKGKKQALKLGPSEFYRTSAHSLKIFYKPIAIQYDFIQSK